MGAAQTPQSRAAISLLAVLAVAKAIMLAGRVVPLSAWTPFVYLWQDVLVALVFGLAGRLVRRPAIIWTAYALLAAYVAINVAVARELSSPLTLTMIRGAGGPLADSIGHGVTLANVAAIGIIAAAAVCLPWLVGRARVRTGGAVVAGAIAFVVTGALATTRLDTIGGHRNAIGTLFPPALPVVSADAGAVDWRASPFATPASEDISRYRGTAQGSNVILISLESTAARYLKIYGADRDPMPNLTRLADRSLVVDDAYAVYPESIKGLFATLCSRFPAYDTPADRYADVPCASLAQELEHAGYRTALFHSGRFDYLDMRAVIEHRGFDVLEDAGAIGGHVDSSFGIDEASSVRRMLAWVDGLAPDQRFFLTYLPIAGHHPYATQEPGPFNGGSEFDQYLNALREGDTALGQLIDGLVARHLDRNTLVVIFGDHGEAFGQHDGNVAHTQFIYDENVRVPYVIVMPQQSPTSPKSPTSPARIHRVMSLIDTAPTILDLLGLPAPAAHQGVSLLTPGSRMALFYTDYSLGWLGLRDACWKYLFQVDASRSTLFDVCADPGETTNRARDHDDRVRAYRARLEQWSSAQRKAIRTK